MIIFIDGPLENGDTSLNIRNAIRAASSIMLFGHAVYTPHSQFLSQITFPQHHEAWNKFHTEFLAKSDAYIRLPGQSVNADDRMSFARMFGIPIFSGPEAFDDFKKWSNKNG